MLFICPKCKSDSFMIDSGKDGIELICANKDWMGKAEMKLFIHAYSRFCSCDWCENQR